MYSYGSPHTAAQKQDDQHERTFSSYVRIQVVVLKTCLGRWTIGRNGERGSGISVLPARYDDDDDDDDSVYFNECCILYNKYIIWISFWYVTVKQQKYIFLYVFPLEYSNLEKQSNFQYNMQFNNFVGCSLVHIKIIIISQGK